MLFENAKSVYLRIFELRCVIFPQNGSSLNMHTLEPSVGAVLGGVHRKLNYQNDQQGILFLDQNKVKISVKLIFIGWFIHRPMGERADQANQKASL